MATFVSRLDRRGTGGAIAVVVTGDGGTDGGSDPITLLVIARNLKVTRVTWGQ